MKKRAGFKAAFAAICAALTAVLFAGCAPVVQENLPETLKENLPAESAANSLRIEGESPEKAVLGAFEYLKSLDEAAMRDLLEKNGMTYPYEGSEELTVSIAREFIDKMSYEVVGVTQDGDTAQVKVKVTSVNIGALIGRVMEKSISMVFSPAYIAKSSQISENDKSMMLLELVSESVSSDITLSESEYTVNVGLSDGVWVFEAQTEILDPLIDSMVEIIGMVS